ncbi:helix-turn-helix domain-containing protein [Coralliovum pocilloporae]|uniref:helix-turn-helix domain-containing protein n=1 Tax=Coralliovum pocilloporae TaxID=3066369 RepID=UPI003307BB55
MAFPLLVDTTTEQNHDVQNTVGGRITRARDIAGLSTSQLARRLGVKTQTLQSWEADRSEPRSNRLTMLAGILNVSPSWLLVGLGASPNDNSKDDELTVLREEFSQLRQSLQQNLDTTNRMLANLDRMLDSRAD